VPVTRPIQSAARDPIEPERPPRSSFVHLVVLSTDPSLLTTMQAAAEGELLFIPVATAESSVEQLVSGRCGILLIDLPCLRGEVQLLLTRLHAQFPGVVLMVAGRREDEAAVASLLTSGIVYRYAHKPLSPGRARQFIAASVRRYHELNEREQFGLATVREMARVQVWQRLFQHSVRIVGALPLW
jgi:DNA-binding response OmpR family regulator